MKLTNPKNPLWPWLGAGLLVASAGLTTLLLVKGPNPIEPGAPVDNFFGRLKGRQGRFTEKLNEDSTFVLECETWEGDNEEQILNGVTGRLNEDLTNWTFKSPRASTAQREGTWILEGPMDIVAKAPGTDRVIGVGRIEKPGPAMKWQRGVWHGLSELSWKALEGNGQGLWVLPSGWKREPSGRFQVDRGPVTWMAAGDGAIKNVQADRMWVDLGRDEASLESVSAFVQGGQVNTAVANLDAKEIRWEAPITFRRDDGWDGTATSGLAPRPGKGQPLNRFEFRDFHARRAVEKGEDRLSALGARWTPEGMRLEGSATWEMPMDGQVLALRSPRMLFRNAPGGQDLPERLPPGSAWAEGTAVLTWSSRSISSPQMEARRADRHWVMKAPTYGKSEMGTFSAGKGSGKPERWEFEGPVQASMVDGSTLRGGKLVWENDVWTLTGRPVTYLWRDERLSGPRIIRNQDLLRFPDGISGFLPTRTGALSLRADRGERKGMVIDLDGRVECRGEGWRLNADHISVTLGPDRKVVHVSAGRNVTLEGQMGEGQGDLLELDLVQKKVRWQGPVRGSAEVRS